MLRDETKVKSRRRKRLTEICNTWRGDVTPLKGQGYTNEIDIHIARVKYPVSLWRRFLSGMRLTIDALAPG